MTSIAFMGARCFYKCHTIYNIFLCPFFISSVGLSLFHCGVFDWHSHIRMEHVFE